MPASSDPSPWPAASSAEQAVEGKPSQMLGRFWTIPNTLSLLRLAVVIPVTYLIWTGGSLEWLFGLIVFGALTDFLDGHVARWSHAVSGWGKILDPLADKFAAVMIISALTFREVEPTLPVWFFLLVVGRDLCILTGGIAIAWRTGQVVMSGAFGKTAVASLALTVLYAVLGADPDVLNYCVWFSTALLVISFLIYVGRYTWVQCTGTLPTRAYRESEPLREDGERDRREPGTGQPAAAASPSAAGPDSNGAPPSRQPVSKEAATENGVSHPS